jgi:flagellar export protein FliJ
MKPFRYKLTAVQRVRDRREHEATEQYAQALAQRENAFRNVEVAERELATGQFECSRLLGDGATAGDLRRQQLGCAWLQERRDQVAVLLEQAEVRVNQALGVMITARRESEAVKKHHDKARESHQREQQREDQRTLDDLPLRTLARLIG